MQVTIRGTKIDTTLISYNDGLNFGRFSDDTVIIPYEIVLEKGNFIKHLEKEYNTIKEEIRLDDVTQNETSGFTNTNYCSLVELLNHPEDLQEIFSTYLDKILFEKLFKNANSVKYIINSTATIVHKNNIIYIRGNVYSFKEQQ